MNADDFIVLSLDMVGKIADALEQAGDSQEIPPPLAARCASLSVILKIAPDHLRLSEYLQRMMDEQRQSG